MTHRAALVEGDCREVEAFKQILIGNTLAHSIFEENHLFIEKIFLNETGSVSFNSHFTEASPPKRFLTLLGLISLRLFSALST